MRTQKGQKGLTEFWKTLILFSIFLIITGMIMYIPIGRPKPPIRGRITVLSK